MKKSYVIILVIGLGLTALIFQLPKGNVSNTTSNAPAGGANRDAKGDEHQDEHTEESATKSEETHAAPLTKAQQAAVAKLKSEFSQAKTEVSQSSVLDKLINTFVGANHYDSAAYYAGQFADQHPALNNLLRAGQLYFEAQTYALNPTKGKAMGEKARVYFEQVLSKDPSNLLVKTNLAMTYVDTPTPMKGITLLREVIEQEPTFVPALFNLGILSIKSNQFGKGQERFTQILKLEPTNYKAALNLGFCLAQLDKLDEAKKVLRMVLDKSKDPEETKAAQELLAEMQKH
ncbi:tetratricopeptide repeat protein [Aquirufa aurantiipilula]|uniref:Tetratricopeptide repeat protein n=1 Tax=Aquirufa aurantiipilula TaxID=2696561 RepID=A0ABT6BI14_9BACT|nr:tetratricopeptide repeat protein [Aquirufa aurantiipilula]MBZ1327248.1 tetratricopeptide repeat protein [Aquirufa aurantiipilula]MDF5690096.1 tetratricopeptide repeat protein [Aquirufa aurantiipilula]